MSGAAAGDALQVRLRDAERALQAREYRRAHELCIGVLLEAPSHADALFLLAMIAVEHGNFAKAAEVIGRALQIDAQRAEYHAQLGRCLVALNRPREALEAAQRALALQPADAPTLDALGVLLSRLGAHTEAVEPLERAVARAPGNAAYCHNLGAALQFVGAFERAAAAYRAALAADPGHYRAWSALSQVAQPGLSEEELERLEALLPRFAADPDAMLHACHALARQCEERGDFARAFALLEQGKRGKRARLGRRPQDDRELFAAAERVGTTGSSAGADSGGEPGEPIFVVGMPRTGTTLVERIISSHPEVFSAGELTHFAVALKRAARTSGPLVLDAPTLEAATRVDLPALGRAYLESTRPRTGHTRHFVDKMPLNFFYAGIIHRALPGARIVCLRRNPLDACLGNYRQLFATEFPYYAYSYDLLDTGRYYLQFDRLMRRWRELLPAHGFREVQYEAVVADTEREARRLLAFCGLEWHPGCLRFHENAAPVATASSVQVRRPIYSTAVGRWRCYERQLEPLIALLREGGALG